MNISDLDNHGNRCICRSVHGFGNYVNQSVIMLITMVTKLPLAVTETLVALMAKGNLGNISNQSCHEYT